ncbi:MAG TPA: DUF6531 domain-containing protein, partial [Xanthomonadaceae bacterium]
MVAVISGSGQGLFNTVLNTLGGGGAQVGQGREQQYVNLATGNLVLQDDDEQLVFRGLAIDATRTYNSAGTFGQTGADGWVTGFERNVSLLAGTLNAAGSVMRLTKGDGSYQDFTYTSSNKYTSTAGDGASDTLTWSSSAATWTYVEGSSREEEVYASHSDSVLQGRLLKIINLKSDATTPAEWDVVYDSNNRISAIQANDGTSNPDAILFGYDA